MELTILKGKFVGWRLDHSCSVVIPLFIFAFRQDTVSAVHRHALDLKRRRGVGAKILKSLVYTIYWPVRAFFLALIAAVTIDRKLHGVDLSRIALFFTFWYLMVRYNMTIEACLRFKLWLPRNRRHAGDYIQHHEIVRLMPWLSRNQNTEEVGNKVMFEALCRKHGLPHAGIVATVTRRNLIINDGTHLPKADLFSKFNGQWGGSGGQAWTYDDVSATWRNGNHIFDEPELLQYFKDAAHLGTIILQLKLINGDAVRDFSSGALCTLRVVTTKLPKQQAEHLRSCLRMPIGQMDVDNFGVGGLSAGIEASGQLTPAIQKRDGYPIYNIHPDTGAQISDTKLAIWEDVLALAIDAHNVLTDVYSIGWDIAWTQHGPIIVEANVGWGEDAVQMPNSDPLGKKFCDFYLSAKAASQERAATEVHST
ncbi:sugar-transfer associated ATP-grasp domain-containing protein [Halocynthiibacter namhaensis]|uniref:sugar-transfer associated ATP-grasp domain-containing protein n=1 Tax=Halocynthiibacter namhaensis TaxID=1290553 RepID=UPI00138E44EE|nr:sugar-transfer associated ATP-grasp domain-containing protein [Halocynthiibacter namhaensis]